MLPLGKAISRAVDSADRARLVSAALDAYLQALPQEGVPNTGQLTVAERKARVTLRKGLWERPWLSAVSGDEAAERQAESLQLAFESCAFPLKLPRPAQLMQLRPRSVAYAAAVGAMVGLVAMMFVSRLLAGKVALDLSIVLAGPLGAFGMVLLVWEVSKSNALRRTLQVTLGVASVAEVWLAVAGPGLLGPLGRVWRMMGYGRMGRRGLRLFSAAKRILLYVAIILLLELATRQPTHDRKAHAEAVRGGIEQWLESAIRLQVALCAQSRAAPATRRAEKIGELTRHLYALHGCSQEELPVAAAELIQEARNAGLSGLEGEPAFMRPPQEAAAAAGPAPEPPGPLVWKEPLQDRYETFGHIEDGDRVIVEREAVVQDGEVINRGLVRKLRAGG